MKNRWLLNLALAALVAGLALLVLLKPGREETRAPLTALDPAAITRAAVARGSERIEFVREAGAWRLTSPLKARANRFNVEALARLATVPVESRLGSINDLGEYGLKQPRARVTLDNDEIALGSLHPLRNQVYALHRGEVVLIGAHHQAAALYPPERFLDTRLIEEGREPVAFRLPDFRLARRNGAWQREPAIPSLSSDRIHDFVQEWRNASALSVERAANRAPLAKIEIVFGSEGQQQTLALAVLAHQPEFVLWREDEGLEYHFPEETGKRLLNLTND
jgi:hypothetical protein